MSKHLHYHVHAGPQHTVSVLRANVSYLKTFENYHSLSVFTDVIHDDGNLAKGQLHMSSCMPLDSTMNMPDLTGTNILWW